MTEEEWLTEAVRNYWMVVTLGDQKVPRTKTGRRKLRLFACACCRVVWDSLPDEVVRAAVLTAEAFADGTKSKVELQTARVSAADMAVTSGVYTSGRVPLGVGLAIAMVLESTQPQAYEAALAMTASRMPLAGQLKRAEANTHLCQLLRDIFGNPFRPLKFNPMWRTEAAVGIAWRIYEERDFRAMPILADALEEAGCDSADILAHCREPGVHVRGCWVVDLVLGKV